MFSVVIFCSSRRHLIFPRDQNNLRTIKGEKVRNHKEILLLVLLVLFIYIYVCVCVCVCVETERKRGGRERVRVKRNHRNKCFEQQVDYFREDDRLIHCSFVTRFTQVLLQQPWDNLCLSCDKVCGSTASL